MWEKNRVPNSQSFLHPMDFCSLLPFDCNEVSVDTGDSVFAVWIRDGVS